MLYVVIALLGVTTSWWEVRDFSKCEFDGVGLSKEGEVILSYCVDSVFETKDMYLWDILLTKDAVYMATGDDGNVYKIRDGKGELFFDSRDENVLTLAEYGGYIYAGTSPGGKIYRIDQKGMAEEVLDSDEEYIWDLVVTPDGRVICGTGGNGLVMAIKNGHVDTLIQTGRINVSLLELIDGDIYVGTGDGGLLYIITSKGEIKGLYDGGEGEISGIIKRERDIYFLHCMDTLSVVKRMRVDGITEDLVTKPGILSGISVYNNMILCTSEKRVYRLYDDGKFELIYQFPKAISAIAEGGYFGLSRFAGLYRLSEKKTKKGIVESYSYDAGGVSKWGRLSYEGKGDVEFQTSSGNTEKPDITWDEWQEIRGDGLINSLPNRFIRWRAKINNSKSYLRSVQIAYLPVNRRPSVRKIDLLFESGGLFFTGFDPDGDQLTFDVYYRDIKDEWIVLGKEVCDTLVKIVKEAFPDGDYQFKVIVSDILSNPPDYAQTSFKVSDIYRIDNTPPVITIDIENDKAIVVVRDNMSEIASFEYSENASEFLGIYPRDGIFDQREEVFEIPIKEETRDIVVRTMDRKNNFSLQKWSR